MSNNRENSEIDQVAALKATAAARTFKVQVLHGSALRKARDRRLLEARALAAEDAYASEGHSALPPTDNKSESVLEAVPIGP